MSAAKRSIPGSKKRWDMYIGGAWAGDNGALFDVVNPATEEVLASVPEATPAQVDQAVAFARSVADSGTWSTVSTRERARVLTQIAEGMAARADDLLQVIVSETGCPVSQAKAGQIDVAVQDMFLWAELAIQPLEVPLPRGYSASGGLASSLAVREPHGVSLAIAPWNFPLYQVVHKLGPALAMGNAVIVKPAPQGSLTALLLAGIIDNTDLPKGTVQFVTGASVSVGESLVSHPGIDHVAFTGSTAVGKRIMQQAAGSLKRLTLELGGKSASIFLEDADLDRALPYALGQIVFHAGQVCTAKSRLLLPRSLYGECVEQLVSLASNVHLGSPTDPSTHMGPLIGAAHRERVKEFVLGAGREGAEVVFGGQDASVDGKGYYFTPTLLGNVKDHMRIAQEEVFGPVLAIMAYDSVDDAVRIANSSVYGLSGAVWSRDLNRAFEVARRLQTGTVEINGGGFNPYAPFGGYKQSGIGRENGVWGLHEYSELKHVTWAA